jgi:hypothetical protein
VARASRPCEQKRTSRLMNILRPQLEAFLRPRRNSLKTHGSAFQSQRDCIPQPKRVLAECARPRAQQRDQPSRTEMPCRLHFETRHCGTADEAVRTPGSPALPAIWDTSLAGAGLTFVAGGLGWSQPGVEIERLIFDL